MNETPGPVVRVGVLGCGNVGAALVQLIERQRKVIEARTGLQLEVAKVAVRNLRRDANEHAKKLLKDKAIGEDEERRSLDEVQRLTDRTIAEIDRLVQAKEAEILAI